MNNYRVSDDWITNMVQPRLPLVRTSGCRRGGPMAARAGGWCEVCVVTEGPGVPGSVQSRLLPDSVMFSPRPVDMSLTSPASETSPPPLTKLVHRKPSSPREFFEKLYGPDTSRDEEKSSSPGPETSVNTNINNNLQGSFPRCDSSNQPLLTSSYLPAFPLPPHEVGLINCSLDNVPFPGGLAAFRKY